MTLEAETVALLRADATLDALAPGGIYADSDLGEEGLTDPVTTPDVWAGGFQVTVVVRERALVPTGDVQDVTLQHTSVSQAVEVWVYARDATALQAALDRVYALMMGKRFTRAFSATWVGGAPLVPAPELPAGIVTRNESYRVVSIRMPAMV